MSPKDLPILSDYDISPVSGFLPAEEPLQILPDPYFAPWEETFQQFNGLLLASRLRQRVQELPLLEASRLKTKAEQRRAYLILCMLSHAYVWGKHEQAAESLPATLAVPWKTVADMLEIQPVLTHAAVVMWNWRLLYKDGPRDLSNLDTLGTLSGSSDESWFYLVTTAIEATGAPVLSKILTAMQLVRDNNTKALIQELESIRGIIEELVGVLRRMFEKCDPYVFYWKVRPYLAGWENMAEAGLPNGVRYEGVDNGEYKKLAGGSAAQSSLIHALDIAFGVEHHPTGMRPKKNAEHTTATPNGTAHSASSMNGSTPAPKVHNSYNDASGVTAGAKPAHGSSSNNFIQKMRFYMPGPHRNFLAHLTEVANIRKYVTDKASGDRSDPEVEKLITVFDECVHQIKVFRDVHIQMVTLYIVMQANRGPSISHGGFAPQPHAQKSTEVNGKAEQPMTNGDSTPAKGSSKGSSILFGRQEMMQDYNQADNRQQIQVAIPNGRVGAGIASPKRPANEDLSDSSEHRPRKVLRPDSPLKGAAGRRLDQQKRVQQQQQQQQQQQLQQQQQQQQQQHNRERGNLSDRDVGRDDARGGYQRQQHQGRPQQQQQQQQQQQPMHQQPPPPPPAPALPEMLMYLLSILPGAQQYQAVRFRPEAMMGLLASLNIPRDAQGSQSYSYPR